MIPALLLQCNKNDEKLIPNDDFTFEYKAGDEVKLSKHPRLLFSKGKEKRILQMANEEPLLNNLINILQERADEILTLPLLEPDAEGKINLSKSREQISRILTLSLAYRIFHNEKYASKYANKVEEELLNVCSYNSWNPEHFLDVAEMTTAVAIGYDWCFNALSTKTKNTVVEAIQDKAFIPAFSVYTNGDKSSWAKRETNWNVVCNSGLVTGALAIAESCPADAKRIIQNAVQYTPNNIKHFAPNGVYYEGPSYWNYTVTYFMLLIDNLQRNLNTDFGLSYMEGVNKTGKYYINTLSPTNRVFNFADAGGTKATYSPVYFFFSNEYNQPELAEFYRNYLQDGIAEGNIHFPRFFFLSIPWYDETDWAGKADTSQLNIFKGEPDILAFTSNNSDAEKLFLSAKSGDPDMPHNQLDVGTFIIEDQNTRWGVDIGSENYSLPGFWDYTSDGKRWDYFRNTNLAHNTLNIDGEIAYSKGRGDLVKSNANQSEPYGIIDMSSFYSKADSVFRGYKMVSPDIMMVRDELTLKSDNHDVNWRLLTDADVENKNGYITLFKNEKEFYIYPLSSEPKIRAFKPNTNTPGAKPLSDITCIEITKEGNAAEKVIITVLMGANINKIRQFPQDENLPLDEWD